MRIAVIGAGRLASCVAPALQKGGAEVCQVWSRTQASAAGLAGSLGCEAVWGGVSDIVRDADIYLLCVKDDAIADIARQLHAVISPKAAIIHTSGSVAMAVLARTGHGSCGVLWPMQTFTKGRSIDFSEVHLFVEATNGAVLSMLRELALTLTDAAHIHRLTGDQRRRLHLAAVFASNFVNHCCALSEDILKPMGMDFSVMRPLLSETVAKLDIMSPAEAQTGPAVRWDEGVMESHRQLLASQPRTRAVYDQLSMSIHLLAVGHDE